MKPTDIPYAPRRVTQRQTSRHPYEQQGVVIPVNKFAWLTPGAVRDLEAGLPLATEMPHAPALLDYEQVSGELQQARLRFLEGFLDSSERVEVFAPDFDFETTASEEQLEYKRLHDRLCRKKRLFAENPPTGLVRRPYADDLIDNIGKINIRSAQTRTFVAAGADPFPLPAHKRPPARIPPAQATTALVRLHMQKVFRAGSEPFRDVDREEDFPVEGLYPPMAEAGAGGCPARESAEERQSILVDPKEYDIFWTKHTVPFTREEVEKMEAWRRRRQEAQNRNDARTREILERRERAIARTFQSRLAFEKELELTDRECDKVTNLGLGKGTRGRLSTWEKAALAAASDPSSLPCRMALWERFVAQVAAYGWITTEAQDKVAKTFRRQLLSGCVVNKQLFWDSISVLDEQEFISRELMIVIECLRDDIGVLQEEWLEYMEKKMYPTQFYFLALDEIEIRENTKTGRPYLIATSRALRRPFRDNPIATPVSRDSGKRKPLTPVMPSVKSGRTPASRSRRSPAQSDRAGRAESAVITKP
jgi:hypothetical protein